MIRIISLGVFIVAVGALLFMFYRGVEAHRRSLHPLFKIKRGSGVFLHVYRTQAVEYKEGCVIFIDDRTDKESRICGNYTVETE